MPPDHFLRKRMKLPRTFAFRDKVGRRRATAARSSPPADQNL